MFEVLMSGVGDAFSCQHWGAHFLVRRGDFVLAIDCPDSYRRALSTHAFSHGDGTLDVEQIDAMILTHLHGDHVNGLEMTSCYSRFHLGRPLELFTSPETATMLWPRLSPSLHVLWDGEEFIEQSLEEFITLHEVEWGTPFDIGPFEIISRPTLHHLPAMAMRITDGEVTLGYSCDTAWDRELITWLEDADVIIHESSLGPAHTPLSKLMELPEDLQKKILVIHYPDALIGADIEPLRFAQEGMIYTIE